MLKTLLTRLNKRKESQILVQVLLILCYNLKINKKKKYKRYIQNLTQKILIKKLKINKFKRIHCQ